MKKCVIFIVCALLVLGILTGCGNSKDKDGTSFTATVLGKDENSLMVEPEEGSSELSSADKISVSLGDAVLVNSEGEEITIEDIEVGDKIQIFYDGAIAESYPAQIFGCYRVVLSR